MADVTNMSASEIAEEHVTEARSPYLRVWAALAVLTFVEYFYAFIFKDWFLVLLLGLLFWAVIKAGLVGWFFMHLKFEGKWVYILIVPAFVLATIIVLALTPDMSMQPETEENPGGESSFVVPAIERPGPMSSIRLAATRPPAGRGLRSAFEHRRSSHWCPCGGRPLVSRSYRLGVQIVVGTLLISASWCLAVVGRVPAPASRAGQDLGPGAFPLGSFQLEASSGRIVTQADLSERVWISAFVFTRCPLSCPRISSAMKGLQSRLARTNVLLVSISVDPEYDTPPILAAYAQRFSALADRWWFLTGSKSSVHELVQQRFKLALAETTAAGRDEGSEMISHSDRLALVDRGQIVGFFESSDGESLDALVSEASRRALPAWVRFLPTVNASLNGLCAGLLLAGWILIRRRHAPSRENSVPSADPAGERPVILRPAVQAHATSMLLAVAASTLFLTSYLVYHGHAGSVSFRHGGWLRIVYFTILLSHTTLATLGVVPLVILTLTRALRDDYRKHAQIAQVTFPIWLYVSITGVVIYLMLYHFPLHASMNALS